MPTRTAIEVEGWSQNKQRINGIFYDQHKDSSYRFPVGHPRAGEQPFLNGRPWWGPCEKSATGLAMPMPVGDLTPMGWDAPWYPPMKYIVASVGRISANGAVVATGAGGLFEARFRIDYVQMIGEYKQAMRDYYDKAVRVAAEIGQVGPDYGGAISYQLRVRVGNPPKSPKVPEAALAGNKWLLGQQVPVFNSRTQRWEVEEDEQLARIIASGDINVSTAPQAEKQADRVAEMEREMAELRALITKNQTPDKQPSAYQQFVKDQNAAGIKDLKIIGAAWRAHKLTTAG